VLEEAGKVPIVEAAVDIWPAEAGPSRMRTFGSSDHFGRFALTGLEAGDFMLTIYKPGYEMFRKRITFVSPMKEMTVRLRQDVGVPVTARDAASGEPLPALSAFELMGDVAGSNLQFHLGEDGVGHLPSALAGSTITFGAHGYVPAVVRGWNGERLDLQLVKEQVH
jgi:hypothetical protein